MQGAVAPMLSVIVTDDEMKTLVSSFLDEYQSNPLNEYDWEQAVNLGIEPVIAIVERLRIAYNIEV